jgi:hypothetical protein
VQQGHLKHVQQNGNRDEDLELFGNHQVVEVNTPGDAWHVSALVLRLCDNDELLDVLPHKIFLGESFLLFFLGLVEF